MTISKKSAYSNFSEIEKIISGNSKIQDVKIKFDYRSKKVTAYIVAENAKSAVINDWKKVFDGVYEASDENKEFNIVGWDSSFTGLPIAANEMKEWVDATVERISDLSPKSIYEIGCGTGLLLFPLQKLYSNYIGVDISKTAIESLNHQIHESNINNTQVFNTDALDFSYVKNINIDTVIINSVTQLFPDIDYFLSVIEKSIDLINGSGHIFIGDILNFNTIESFNTFVQLSNPLNKNKNIAELLDIVDNKLNDESMLYLAPEIFFKIKEKYKKVSDVKITLKSGYSQNEMTKYRYDAILSINSTLDREKENHIDINWSDDLHDIKWFEELIIKEIQNTYHIKNISNIRIPFNIEKIYEIDFYNKEKTISELENIIFDNLPGIDPGQIIDLCKKHSKIFNVCYSKCKNGEFDLCLYPDKSIPVYSSIFENQTLNDYSSYSNQPHTKTYQQDLIFNIKLDLLKHFSADEIPDDFLIVDEIPNTEEITLKKEFINDIPAFFDADAFNYCLHELFEAQVKRTPDAIAISFENENITYAQLNNKSNKLANFLLINGVRVDDLVGIMLERSTHMVIAILATLKAGAAYVPLDPNSPRERINFILQDASIKLLISDKSDLDLTPKTINVNDLNTIADIKKQSSENIDPKQLGLTSKNIAYVIYTSGSTGNPKGVLVEHRNVIHLFDSTYKIFDFSENDVWTLFHSFAFDFSVWEIWGALNFGGRLVIVPQWIAKDTYKFYELLFSEKITVLNQTPSAFYPLISIDAQRKLDLSLRLVIFGGEALALQALHTWINHHDDEKIKLFNMYGITETTVHVTYQRITETDIKSDAGSIIGKPIDNMHIVLLDDSLKPVTSGEIGEAYICGNGVTRGYLNQPSLTKERFISISSMVSNNLRLYKTGDLLREISHGKFEYIGRVDQQVKIRGFRIELREIENTLLRLKTIQDAVVIVKENTAIGKLLVAYIVKNPDCLVSDVECMDLLKAYAAKHLPDYMIPSYFIFLEKIPLTENGKIDKKSLPESIIHISTEGDSPTFENDIESSVYHLVKELLGVQHLEMSDSFFALGGHSLLAARVISQIKFMWNIEISLRDFFEFKNIKDISNFISNSFSSENLIEIEI